MSMLLIVVLGLRAIVNGCKFKVLMCRQNTGDGKKEEKKYFTKHVGQRANL
jgi:hypothetical protein